MSGEGYGVYWRVAFRCDDDPPWLGRQTDVIVDALAATALWQELQVYGTSGEPGEVLEGVSGVKEALRDPQVMVLARGDRDATVERDRPPARVTIEPQDSALALTAIICGESLARVGPRSLTEYSEAVAELTRRFRPHARLVEAWATPIDRPRPFTYPRVRPPRVTTPYRALNAIVDVLDPTFTETPRNRANLDATRAMASAELPARVARTERAGVVTQRWVEDPRDRAAVDAACTRHERWLLALLPSRIAPGWTEEGDQRLGGYPRAVAPPIALLLRDSRDQQELHHAHVALETAADGAVSEAAWDAIAPLARVRALPDGTALDEVRLLVPSRAAALALGERARAAGFDRVVYRDPRGAVWDPAPPGPWVG